MKILLLGKSGQLGSDIFDYLNTSEKVPEVTALTRDDIDVSDPDFPVSAIQTEGTNPTTTTVVNNQTVFSENDGFYQEGELTGHLYFDVNGNGMQDTDEPNMPNVEVIITDFIVSYFSIRAKNIRKLTEKELIISK